MDEVRTRTRPKTRSRKGPRAAIYARVSRDKRRGRSVAEQEAEGRVACDVNGWNVVKVFTDNSIPASRFTHRSREDWERLCDDIDSGEYDVLVLWEPSRGSRDLTTWIPLLDVCRRRGVLVHVVSHGRTYDPANYRDRRSLVDDGVDSEFESEKSSARIIRAMTANAVAGRPHGRIPYGYMRRYNPATGALVSQEVDPVAAPIVREVFQRLGTGEPVLVVVRDLNERGIPASGRSPWTRQIVRRIALNRVYIGQREHAGDVYPGTWEPIVTDSEFYAARRVLTDPARTTTRPGKYKHLLSYIARCGVCEAHLTCASKRGYFCSVAGHVGAAAEFVDEVVKRHVIDLMEDSSVIEMLSRSDDAAVMEARDEEARLRERLGEFVASAVAGQISPATMAQIEAGLVPQIEAARKKVLTVSQPAAFGAITVDGGPVAQQWEGLSMAQRRQIVAGLVTVHLDPSTTRGRTEPSARQYADRVRITRNPTA